MALRIMVVDDEPAVLKLIKSLLERLDCEVLALGDSREAARRIDTDKFDGILVDANMPYLDGFALIEKLRSSPVNSTVPAVMLTGDGDVQTMRKAFKAGITFFLSKPVNKERLGALMAVMRGPMLKEKRHYARMPFRTAVTCQLDTKQFKAVSVNISKGGMLLEGSGGARHGDELNVEFMVPLADHQLRARAKVIRMEAPDRIALQFLKLEPQSQLAIEAYISGQVKG